MYNHHITNSTYNVEVTPHICISFIISWYDTKLGELYLCIFHLSNYFWLWYIQLENKANASDLIE